jgi:hypothetical protein
MKISLKERKGALLIFQLASTRRFLLFKSLCMIFLEWRNAMARAISAAICTRSFHAISTSGFFRYRRKSPPGGLEEQEEDDEEGEDEEQHERPGGGGSVSVVMVWGTRHVFGDEVDVGAVRAHADELDQVRVRIPGGGRRKEDR